MDITKVVPATSRLLEVDNPSAKTLWRKNDRDILVIALQQRCHLWAFVSGYLDLFELLV